MQPGAPPILPKGVAWSMPARPVTIAPCDALERGAEAQPIGNAARAELERRLNPKAETAAVIEAHTDSPAALAIAAWLKAGARGSLDRWLEGGDRHAMAERDALLRGLAAFLWPGEKPSVTAQADRIATELSRYASTRWRFDRASISNPHPARSLRGVLFEVLKLRDVVLSPRQLRKILAGPAIEQEKDSARRNLGASSEGEHNAKSSSR